MRQATVAALSAGTRARAAARRGSAVAGIGCSVLKGNVFVREGIGKFRSGLRKGWRDCCHGRLLGRGAMVRVLENSCGMISIVGWRGNDDYYTFWSYVGWRGGSV
jgi:hypothetical protein